MAKTPTAAKKAAHPAKPAKASAKETAASKNGNGAPKNGAKAAKPAAKPAKSAKPPAPAKPAPPPPPPKVNKARTDLAAKVVHLIAEEMAVEEAELTPTASFKEDLGLDEIDVAELLMQAEQAFAIHPFSEADWESCETVDDFVQLIVRRVEAKRGKKPAAKE
ncbi:MAG TPA: acyl carrier protein [Terriglobales bacterium]|nr:acyl carrier protein [Terriglobales bacterium]